MKIKIDDHAKERAIERGATEDEIYETLKNGGVLPARNNRFAREKIFLFEGEWNGKIYKEKQVKVIYIIEMNILTIITVIVKYGKFITT